jgi:hypothetical protein
MTILQRNLSGRNSQSHSGEFVHQLKTKMKKFQSKIKHIYCYTITCNINIHILYYISWTCLEFLPFSGSSQRSPGCCLNPPRYLTPILVSGSSRVHYQIGKFRLRVYVVQLVKWRFACTWEFRGWILDVAQVILRVCVVLLSTSMLILPLCLYLGISEINISERKRMPRV